MRAFHVPVITVSLFATLPCMADFTTAFTRIVRTGDPIPGSATTYTNLSRASGSNGNFAWFGSGTGVAGIYKRVGGVDSVVAQSGMSVPSGAGTWSTGSFSNSLGKIDGNDVAFRAGGGIYASFGGAAPIRIADNSMVNPATGVNFDNLQQPYISNGSIAVTNGVLGASAGTVRYNAGVLSGVWSTSTPLPAPMSGNMSIVSQAVHSDGDIAMQAYDAANKQAIITNRSGSLEVVASGYETMPGQSFNFLQFLDPDIKNDDVSFIAWGPAGSGPGGSGFFKGIYRDDGGPLSVIADTSMIAPEVGVTFKDFARGPSIFGDTVLFSASTTTTGGLEGIYVRYNGELHRVIDKSQMLDGKTVSTFDLMQESLYDVDKATFLATFTDGSKGIYSVTFTPEPGTLSLLGIGAMWLLGRRRQA